MPRIPADASHCAIRLRTTLSNLSRQLRAASPAEGMSVAKLSALGQLHRSGAMTPTELAQRERVKLQSLTRLLAELDADGWVRRTAHARDGRQSVLSLTPAGVRQLTAQVHQRESSLAQAIQQQLAADEQALLLQACALIDRVADSLASPAMAAPATSRTP